MFKYYYVIWILGYIGYVIIFGFIWDYEIFM